MTPINWNLSEIAKVSGIRYQVSGMVKVSGLIPTTPDT
jgi:hypothetical protein